MKISGNRASTEIWAGTRTGTTKTLIASAEMDRCGRFSFSVATKDKDGEHTSVVHDPREQVELNKDLAGFAKEDGELKESETARMVAAALAELKNQLGLKRENILNSCPILKINAAGFIRFLAGAEFFLPVNGKPAKTVFMSRIDFGKELAWKPLARIHCEDAIEMTGSGPGSGAQAPISIPPGEYEIYEGDESQIGITQIKGERT